MKTYAITGTITTENGTLEGAITGVETTPVDPPVEPPPVEPPAGPIGSVTDLAVAAGGANSVVLSWTAVAGATNYNIQGSRDNRIWADIGNTHFTTYLVGGLPAGEPYWARVFTEDIDGEWGPVGNVATATTEVPDTPAPPTTPPPPGGKTNLSAIKWAPDWRSRNNGWNVGNTSGTFSTNAVIDNSVMLGDHPSARDDIKYGEVGDGGNNDYIGVSASAGALHEGDELWFRVWQYTSAGFNHNCEGPGGNESQVRKTLRLSGGGQRCDFMYCGKRQEVWDWNTGKNVIYEDGSWHVLYESVDDRRYLDLTGKFKIPDMEWTCLEAYVKFSTSPNRGEVRMWFNGEQVGDTHNFQTTQSKYLPGGSSPDYLAAMFINYWNTGSPKDQTLWTARPAIAVKMADGSRDDTRHMDRDAVSGGFPFIGMAI